MRAIMLFLRVMLFVILFFLIVRMGLQILIYGVRFWYISIPALLLIYLLISGYWKNKKAEREFFHTPFHPNQEVKPEKEPIVTDVEQQDKTPEENNNSKQEDT